MQGLKTDLYAQTNGSHPHLGTFSSSKAACPLGDAVTNQVRIIRICARGETLVSAESLDGRNRAIVTAESLARVFAVIRITSVRWRSYLPHKNTEFGPCRPCVRCTAIRIAQLVFVGVVFIPRGTAEWLARVDCVR